MAETDQREGIELQGNFSANEQEELITVIKKMITLRDVVLKVNNSTSKAPGSPMNSVLGRLSDAEFLPEYEPSRRKGVDDERAGVDGSRARSLQR